MVLQQKPLEKADFIVKITGPVMVRPASSDKWKAPLDRYSVNRLLTCTCPQGFLNCRCNMDCKSSIVFYHFTGYLDRICY